MTLFDLHPYDHLRNVVGFAAPAMATGILVLNALLHRFLARTLQATLRLSSSLASVNLVVNLGRCFAGAGDIETVLRVIASISLSVAFAQTGFVFAIDFVLGRNGKRPIQPMVRYALLGLIFVMAALAGLRAGGVTTVGVLASGAVAVGGLGAALAEMLRQVGSGVMVQYARPFEVGDVIQVAGMPTRAAVVMTSWRTTLVRGNDDIEVLVPNSEFVTHSVVNFGHGERSFRRDVTFEGTYDTPPGLVQSVVLGSLRGLAGLEESPAPLCLMAGYRESGIAYELRYWTRRAADYELVDAEVRSRVWYAFARAGIAFPFPTRTLYLAQRQSRADELRHRIGRIRHIALFAHLPEEALEELAEGGREAQYGAGETIVTSGEAGREMHLILEGEVRVMSDGESRRDGKPREPSELKRLAAGDYFGEMSLLTGESRAATVIAISQTRTFVLDEPNFKAMLERNPTVAEALSDELAARQEELVHDEPELDEGDRASRLELKELILSKIRRVFGFGGPK